MNSINILHTHSYDKHTAWLKAEEMLEEIASDYGLQVEHDGESEISFTGSGISGDVKINHNEITFTATLGFLMAAMKPVIASAIQKKLDEKFD
ncbi:MAG: polyhydroxyalkanoic acid system family protein [Marinicellaceae bacterium]